MTDDLVAFLRARLDEDEQIALEALDLPPMVGEWQWARVSIRSTRFSPCGRHHPARVLREVEAKRQIIAAYEQRESEGQSAFPAAGAVFALHATGLLIAIRVLASVYADHPDYRADWRE